MRIVSTPKRKDNGHPFICTLTLLKDSEIKHPKDNLLVWNGYGRVERLPKGEHDSSVVFAVTAMSPLADKLIPWKKGTTLFIAGSLVLDEYWTKRNGKDCYKIMAEYVAAQLDYAAAERQAAAGTNDADDGISSEEYDSGF